MPPGLRKSLWSCALAISLLLIASLGLAACTATPEPANNLTPRPEETSAPANPALETTVQEIPLAGPISSRKAELSGMSWYGDWLILLPQYPGKFGSQDEGAVFALPKAEILAVLDGKSTQALKPVEIPFDDQGISGKIKGFEGFECITFNQDTVYLSIESKPDQMLGYLVSGSMQRGNQDIPSIRLDPDSLVEIPTQTSLANFSYESCLVYQDQVIGLYEANGQNINPAPQAKIFDLRLQAQGDWPFPNIEYRITDATPPDPQGRFWAINYLFPGDVLKLKPLESRWKDPLAQKYGEGKTHVRYTEVERLLQFQIGPDSISLVDTPPIQLVLPGDDAARNWEGIAILAGRGFLIATDTFPETILGFVPFSW